MLNKTGAGAQHPIRSHWMLRPSPQSYKNSKRQSKRYRANIITANSKTSATTQTAQQPQPAPPPPNTTRAGWKEQSPHRNMPGMRRVKGHALLPPLPPHPRPPPRPPPLCQGAHGCCVPPPTCVVSVAHPPVLCSGGVCALPAACGAALAEAVTVQESNPWSP